MNMSELIHPPVAPAKGLAHTMRQHPLVFYFLLAYAISWLLFIPYLLAERELIPGTFNILFYTLHTYGPTISAFILTALLFGKTGVKELRQRIRQKRAGRQWYLFILVGIPALALLGILSQPAGRTGFHDLSPVILASYPFYFLATFLAGGPLGEEVGWRGFALPRMQKQYGPFWGTLLLGVLWSGWHLIDFLTASKGGGEGTGWSTFLGNFPIFTLAILSLSVMFTWIYNRTGGNLFLAILTHTSVNILEALLMPKYLTLDEVSLHRAMLVAFGGLALLLLLLTRGRLGYQPEEEKVRAL